MQSRGFFTGRRSTDESTRGTDATVRRSNGDVIRNHQDHRFADRLGARIAVTRDDARHCHGRAGLNHRDRSLRPRSVCPRERNTDANYADREHAGTQPRRVRQRDYAASYEDRESWSKGMTDLNDSKPVLRNGFSHGRGERIYSSTLPRRSRTINFTDQPTTNSLVSRRGYSKTRQDLSDLELDDGLAFAGSTSGSFLSSVDRDRRNDRSFDDGHRRRRYREEQLEDDYLRLYRSLSRLNNYPQGGKYEPGQVHYERECRTFGKDTVAFIYYKTCYL